MIEVRSVSRLCVCAVCLSVITETWLTHETWRRMIQGGNQTGTIQELLRLRKIGKIIFYISVVFSGNNDFNENTSCMFLISIQCDVVSVAHLHINTRVRYWPWRRSALSERPSSCIKELIYFFSCCFPILNCFPIFLKSQFLPKIGALHSAHWQWLSTRYDCEGECECLEDVSIVGSSNIVKHIILGCYQFKQVKTQPQFNLLI